MSTASVTYQILLEPMSYHFLVHFQKYFHQPNFQLLSSSFESTLSELVSVSTSESLMGCFVILSAHGAVQEKKTTEKKGVVYSHYLFQGRFRFAFTPTYR